MFGHDNQDNGDDNSQNDDNGQITLPPAQDLQDSEPADVPPPVEQQEETAAEDVPVERRKDVRAGAPTDDLLDIKQEVLQALTPLVDHLDQSPEEKFRTTMMMIQASDNHALIKTAYQAAQQISNEKERAQALLDIVNEINYFTQQNQEA